MFTLLLTRHGLPTAATNVWLGGRMDVPLSPDGRAQAEALALRLTGVRIDRIISSPMLRAVETATATATAIATGRPVEVDERLREQDCGRWEGLTFDDATAREPELRALWELDPAANHLPGGESGDEVAERARSFLADLLATELPSEGDRRVLVVAHTAVNRILLCVALGIPVRDYRRRFVQGRTNLTALRYEDGDGLDGARLLVANDVSHLRDSAEAAWT
jgi:broad specificity phosphatase PhoE